MNNAEKLPDSYAKHKESNNYKLLNLNEQAIATLKKDMDDVLKSVDIQQATGKTLDLYGDMVGQQRGSLTDVQYRFMILTKVGINITQGSYDTILGAACRIFDCEPSDIVLNDSENPCRVVIDKFPFDVLVNAGFSSEQAVEMLEMLLPIGVTIDSGNFAGTFEFAETYGEYDEYSGFGDVAQTVGGYFGVVYDSNSNTILPV